CAAELSVFGIEAVGNQPEFLDRVEVGNHASAEVAALADVAAVHQERVGGLTLTVNGDVAGVQVSGNRTILLDRLGRGRSHAGLQSKQVDIAAAIEREGEHLLGVDYVAELSIFGFHADGIGGNVDGL